MGGLYACSACCMVLSVWAIVQLSIMGICYKFEAPVLLEDVDPRSGTYGDYDDFINITTENYAATALNCWIVAGVYVVTLGLSCIGLKLAKRAEKKAADRRDDDEYSCQPMEMK